MQCVRKGDVVAIKRKFMQELREDVEYRMADVGMGAHDEGNYITYWMASYMDVDIAYEMIKIFDEAVGHDPHVWNIFGTPTYIAAKMHGNNKILSFLPPMQLIGMYDTDLF
jgi:hypothetical protein